MIFIDASFYLSHLNPQDNNHQKAIEIGKNSNKNHIPTTLSFDHHFKKHTQTH